MHAPAQFQTDIVLERDRVGADLHLLIGGDARVGTAEIRRTDAAAGQQCFARQAFGFEGVEDQRDGVEGGEVGVEHGHLPQSDHGITASCVPPCWRRLEAFNKLLFASAGENKRKLLISHYKKHVGTSG